MRISKQILAIVFTICGITTNLSALPSVAAEKITFFVPIFGEFQISVEDLAVFAEEGEITPQLAYYANRLDPKTLEQLRKILQTRIAVEPIAVYRLTNTPIGEDFLQRLGNLIYTHPERNGLFAIRAALIQASIEPEGLTPINFLRHFPTTEIQLNTDLIFSLVKEAENFFQYKDTSVEAIALQAQEEIITQRNLDLSTAPDLSQQGEYLVNKRAITFSINDIRQTNKGFTGDYQLNLDIYAPESFNEPAPLVIIAHGLGSERSEFAYLAEHLASYGYIVVVPEHIGSDGSYQQAYLQGEVSVGFSPLEFYSRPRDITHLLDELEQHPDYQQKINWTQIGILGHSLGGTTALLTSGAPLNLARLADVCTPDYFSLNISILLQCRASRLPPGEYDFQDKRIKAVAVFNPVTSSVLGIESLEQIDIPTLIMGGTMDLVAPYIDEQMHPFLWLNTSNKYLATIVNGSHSFGHLDQNDANILGVNTFLKTPRPDLGRKYLKSLSLGFFEAHIKDRPEAINYLTSGYAKKISNPELPLHLITSLRPEQLELSYGDTLPISPIQEKLVLAKPQQKRNVLAEIKQSGILKIAIRQDALPFGNYQGGQWTGYCADLATTFSDQLSQKLDVPIKVAITQSTLSTRFDLVEQGVVHLECGPNSIVSNREEIVFSDPFFVSGTRFLVNNNRELQLDPNSSLEGIKIGVSGSTTTAKFLEQKYPDANIIVFKNENTTSRGIKAVKNGDIDAFFSDGVLLTGEIDSQGWDRKNYQIIPENPLTCDYYGLILPQGDQQWQNIVNLFLRDRTADKVFDRWLINYYDQTVADLDYCQN